MAPEGPIRTRHLGSRRSHLEWKRGHPGAAGAEWQTSRGDWSEPILQHTKPVHQASEDSFLLLSCASRHEIAHCGRAQAIAIRSFVALAIGLD
jgi:hypothetical protein